MSGSSSAHKVARVAAKSGTRSGPANSQKRNWTFAAAVVAVLALGIGVLSFARAENEGLPDNDDSPRAQVTAGEPYDHWHAAFAFSVCGTELAPVQGLLPDQTGVHTHDDGLIHIHPFTTRVSGKRATLQKFFKEEDLVVTDDGFTTQDGKTYKVGETECGGKPTVLRMAHWKDAATAAGKAPDEIFEKDFGSVRFTEDLGAYTISLDVDGADIPVPSAAAQIEQLGALDASPQPTEGTAPITVVGGADTTGAPVTETTAAGAETTEAPTETTAAASE